MRRVAFVALLAGAGAFSVPSFPVYQPHQVTRVQWPQVAPTPQDRGMDVTIGTVPLHGNNLRLVRRETARGDCVIQESFLLYAVDSPGLARAKTQRDSSVAVKRLWQAPSYETKCLPGLSSQKKAWWAGGCLLIADDSLMAYGVVSDTVALAKAFADSLAGLMGYYRFNRRTRVLERVARVAPTFATRCRLDVHEQARDRAHF